MRLLFHADLLHVLVAFIATAVGCYVGYKVGFRVGYVHGRRDERLEWQPPTPKRRVN